MNVSRTILTAGLLALAMAVGAPIASAQKAIGDADIAVVDVQFLMNNLAAATDVRAHFEAMRSDHDSATVLGMDTIAKAYGKLVDERDTLSKDEYQQFLQDLRDQAGSFQSAARQRQASLDEALSAALKEITDAIEDAVNQIMRERMLSLILPRSSVIGTPALPDITEAVLERVNELMPSVVIILPD